MLHAAICASVDIIPSSWLLPPARLPNRYPRFWSDDSQAKGHDRTRETNDSGWHKKLVPCRKAVLYNGKPIQSEPTYWAGQMPGDPEGNGYPGLKVVPLSSKHVSAGTQNNHVIAKRAPAPAQHSHGTLEWPLVHDDHWFHLFLRTLKSLPMPSAVAVGPS